MQGIVLPLDLMRFELSIKTQKKASALSWLHTNFTNITLANGQHRHVRLLTFVRDFQKYFQEEVQQGN